MNDFLGFGGLFDVDGDGSLDAGETAFGLMMMDEELTDEDAEEEAGSSNLQPDTAAMIWSSWIRKNALRSLRMPDMSRMTLTLICDESWIHF